MPHFEKSLLSPLMNRALILSILVLSLLPVRADDRLQAAQAFLDQHRVHKAPVPHPENYEALRAKVSAGRDPETKFGPYLFGLTNPKSGILSKEPLAQLRSLIEAKSSHPIDWHDARNIVRVQSLLALWAYAAEPDSAKAADREQEWNRWNELRLAYMFEEFVLKERFQRTAWALFTPKQRQQIVAGKLDSLIKKNTGHSRSFSANKQVIKALGKPVNQTAFDNLARQWEARWEPVRQRIQAAAKFDRQRELAMDQADSDFALAAWKEQRSAFDAFTRAERDAIRDLIQEGYQKSPDLAAKVAAYQKGLHSQMVEKYQENGGELLRQLGELE